MICHTTTVTRGPDGKWVTVKGVEDIPETPQMVRAAAMAEAKPGEIVFGISCPQHGVEQEHYLSQL